MEELIMPRVLLCSLVLLLLAPLVQAELPVLSPMDIFDLEWSTDPQISADGRHILYVRNFFDVGSDRRRSNLWMVEADGGNHRPITTGDANDSQPRFSPDGRRIAYVSSREGGSQIWVHWLESGQSGRITRLGEAPSNLTWSPDGTRLAFTMRVPLEAKPLATMPRAPKGADWGPPVRVIERLYYRADGSGYVEPGHTHLFVLPADGGTPRQLTAGEFDHGGDYAWLPDGSAIIVTANRDEDWEYQQRRDNLWRVSVEDGAMTRLSTRKGQESAPRPSPDGRRIAYLGFDDRGLAHQDMRLFVLDLASGESRLLSDGLDRSIREAQWDERGRGLYVSYDDQGETVVGWIGEGGGTPRELARDYGGTAMGRPYTGGSMSVSRTGRVAYTAGSVHRPANVAVVDRGSSPRRLTDLSGPLLAQRRLGRVEEFRTPSSHDEESVHAWIVYPPEFDEAVSHPLLLEIHGGPHAAYGPLFAPEIQLYAALGYVVVYANPRGSTSYGEGFANWIHQNYPSEDYDDLMSVVDAVVAKGYIDEQQLFVTGGSGGGVLTAWIVGTTDRFRAAVVAKPVINWMSFALTSDGYAYYQNYWFPAPPWEQPEHYLRHSPLMRVGSVTTPTMVITGEEDLRTPISESEQYYQALKLRRVDTALARIPGASHGINRRPSHLIAQVLHTVAWFERYRPDVLGRSSEPEVLNAGQPEGEAQVAGSSGSRRHDERSLLPKLSR
jgi:dipeptidyl aminopeptidase/acylaminoacyl peptidase